MDFSNLVSDESDPKPVPNWYDPKYNLEKDPKLFRKKAQSDFESTAQHLDHLRIRKESGDRKNRNKIDEAQKNLTMAERKFKVLKSASEGMQGEARQEFDAALESLQRSVEEASAANLSEKELFKWKTGQRANDLKYQIGQMKAANETALGDIRNQLAGQIKNFEKKHAELEAKLKKMDESKEKWEDLKKKTEEDLKTLERQYQKILRREQAAQQTTPKSLP